MSDKHAKFPECIPVSQRRISLNIDDLPDLQPYSRVSSKAYERYDRTEDIFRGGNDLGIMSEILKARLKQEREQNSKTREAACLTPGWD